jgi:hypothetical protein
VTFRDFEGTPRTPGYRRRPPRASFCRSAATGSVPGIAPPRLTLPTMGIPLARSRLQNTRSSSVLRSRVLNARGSSAWPPTTTEPSRARARLLLRGAVAGFDLAKPATVRHDGEPVRPRPALLGFSDEALVTGDEEYQRRAREELRRQQRQHFAENSNSPGCCRSGQPSRSPRSLAPSPLASLPRSSAHVSAHATRMPSSATAWPVGGWCRDGDGDRAHEARAARAQETRLMAAAVSSSSDRGVAVGEVIYGKPGERIVRHGIGRVLGAR